MYRYASFCLLLTLHNTLLAEEEVKKEHAFSSLELLPLGSILKNVKIPRYNPDFSPHSFIKAEKIEVISEKKISVSQLHLEQFDKNGGSQLEVDLRTADYFKEKGIISSQQALSISNDELKTTAQGIIIHWNSQRAFLFGPGHTIYKKETSTAMNRLRPLSSSLIAGAFITALPAQEFSIPSNEKKKIEAQVAESHSQRELEKALNQDKANAVPKEQIQSEDAKKFIQDYAPEKEKALFVNAEPKVTPQKSETEFQGLTISFEGGAYFDSKKNVASYIKNVTINEPRLKLSCAKELKVILETVNVPQKDQSVKTKKAVKTILAIGNVKLHGKTEEQGKTKTIVASADIVEYNYKTKKAILKGGSPSIKVTDADGSSFSHTSRAANQWIVVEKDGSFRIEGGGKQILDGLNK